MECNRNKWDYEVGGSGGCFKKGKDEFVALTEMKVNGRGELRKVWPLIEQCMAQCSDKLWVY